MAYRTDGELERGLELLVGKTDFLGQGFLAETLFPDLFEEEERSGINIKEYEERINSMGFLKCVDGLDCDKLFFEESLEIEDDLIFELDPREEEESEVDDFCSDGQYSNFIASDFLPPWQEQQFKVIVSERRKQAKKLIRKHEFVLLRMPNGSAVFL